MIDLIIWALLFIGAIVVVRWALKELRALPSYIGLLGRFWHVGFRASCGIILIFLISPILVIIPLSFNAEPYFTYPMPGVSLRWYEDFFIGEKSAVWHLAIKNSVIVAVFATLLATSLGTVAAVGLSNSRLPYKTLLMGILISPMIVPLVITGVGMYFFYTLIGITPSQIAEYASWLHLTPIIMAHAALGTPFVVITVTATLVGFDHSLTRASASLGADGLTTFFKVTVPLVLPGMISGALFAFITSFDEVVVALFLAGAEQYTVPRQMFSGIREQISPTILAVATVLVLLSVILLTMLELLRRRNERMRGMSPG
ncbi:MAG: putative spermidine/putrescine transport system permease protein [Gammaproteobacteria bacterium]|jgi:putative spermidine/putrescine transport system permease protein